MTSLFNEPAFNESLFNGGGSLSTVYSTDSVAFENTSLNDGTNIVLTQPVLKGPARVILGGEIPRDDGSYVTGSFFRDSAIELKGFLKAASKSAMATYLDTLRKLLSKQEGSLDIIEDDG